MKLVLIQPQLTSQWCPYELVHDTRVLNLSNARHKYSYCAVSGHVNEHDCSIKFLFFKKPLTRSAWWFFMNIMWNMETAAKEYIASENHNAIILQAQML